MGKAGPNTNTPDEASNTSGLIFEPAPPTPLRPSNKELEAKKKAAQEKRKAALDTFLAQPRESQRKLVEDKWAVLCYQLVDKAGKYAQNVNEKDFGKLSQLITSAAIAKDKVFHREDAKQPGNVVFNLFGNVGLDAIKKMLQPPLPEVKELPHVVTVESVDPPAELHPSLSSQATGSAAECLRTGPEGETSRPVSEIGSGDAA